MLIGKKESFAVEYVLDNNPGGEWLYGKICYWIAGQQIGDYEQGTSLRDVFFQMKYLISDCGNRKDERLCCLPPEKVFRLLKESMYGESGDIFTNILDTPARFEISIHVDVFDEWKIFLIDCDNYSKILYKKIDGENVYIAHINNGEFDDVIKEFYRKIGSKYDAIVNSLKNEEFKP